MSDAVTAADHTTDEGRQATSPARMPAGAWKTVFVRTWKESSADSVGLIAAGVSYYVFLAIVPLLGATALSYGLIADLQTVNAHIGQIVQVLPGDAGQLIAEQLVNVVQTSSGKKGLGLLLALAIALFGARNAAGSAINALNIAYEEEERRGFVKLNLLALAMTAAAVVGAAAAIAGIGAMSFLDGALPSNNPVIEALSVVFTYGLLGLVGATGAALLYRYGPSRDKPQWRWLTPGSVLFGAVWVLLTFGFGYYASHFGNYGATYGSLSAVIVLLTWLYLSAYALIFGAELNSELEHQTARDTTDGPERPLGERGAWVADHVASKDDEPASRK
ncbi:YihY/virulence factor BrkB family protein [Parafrankia sp. BMG5.11]|uniref:YihY/virulence factor BrkB family protein n=1 Tax=Parafrankia sp. BMG5.11 TaxID=222540 RepID=UPI00103AC135|nr:YihY/virulence factor BrkB family protein [Parafrankia sp. BMG5.11]TCJ39953.1 YihY/virulence factor BrkB family protein [Parafrankia sp. BMG5.11]